MATWIRMNEGQKQSSTAKLSRSSTKRPERTASWSERVRKQARSKGHPVLQLQRRHGNQAVQHLLRSGAIQRKRRVDSPNGRYEREADRVAEKALRTPEPVVQGLCTRGSHPSAGGECSEYNQKKRVGLQTKLKVSEPGDIYEREAERIANQVMAASVHPGVSGAPPRIQRLSSQSAEQVNVAPASVYKVLSSPGKRLDPTLRQNMEQRFGYDFSQVRVHSGVAAEQSARDVNAHAYTVGQDIVFGAGGPPSGDDAGRNLLAHELVHVIQQGAAVPRNDALSELDTGHDRSLITPRSQDRNTLQRRVTADVLTTSVGEFYTQQLTPDELRMETTAVVVALGLQTLPDDQRQLLELNLQTLEEHALVQGVDLPTATAYRLRQVTTALATDVQKLGSQLKEILRIKVEGQSVVEPQVLPLMSPFYPEADWDIQQLSWLIKALSEAVGLTATAEAGGAQSTQQFSAAGTRVTAALFGTQAVAIHLAYLHAGVVAASDIGNPLVNQKIASKVRMVREELEPMLQELRSLDPGRVERAVTELQSPWHGFQTDFSSFVEGLEEHARTMHRIRKVTFIIELAMFARGLMRSRSGGGSSISGGPGISGAAAGGISVARGAVGSVEWLEAMRRLAAIGAISTAAAVGRIGGGTAGTLPMPPKPTLTAAAPVKATSAPAPSKSQPSWADLEKSAEASARSRPTGTYGSQSVRSGNREVIIVEGKVAPPVPDAKLVAKARRSKPTLQGEHAMHSGGAQLGENLPQAIASGPARKLNLSAVKVVEDATRATFDEALLHGGAVETRTVLHIEHRIVKREEVPVLVGVRRQAWVRVVGSDKSITFIDFEARIDPVSRAITIVRNLVQRPPPATP